MLVIAGRVRLHQTELEEAVRAGSVIVVASRAEPGCIDYRYAIDIEDPLALQLFERWDSAAALEAHFTTPHSSPSLKCFYGRPMGGRIHEVFEVLTAAPLFG